MVSSFRLYLPMLFQKALSSKVTRIAEGAINDHNLAATSDQVIKVPSRIVCLV